MPAVSFPLHYIITLFLSVLPHFFTFLKDIVESSLQDKALMFFFHEIDNDSLFYSVDSCDNNGYAFLYGIDDDEDLLCYSVSSCACYDLNSVLSIGFSPVTAFSIESFTGTAFDLPVVKRSVTRYFLDDDDVSSDLFLASDCPVILPAVFECTLPKMRRSPRIAAMPAVNYKKFLSSSSLLLLTFFPGTGG